MLTPSEIQRYSRHLLLKEVGLSGQLRLKNARVLLIGAGGLGSPVGLYLAAAGVGTIIVVDNDIVDISNLQRQVIFSTEHVGRSKAEVAAKCLSAINPEITVIPLVQRFDSTNAAHLVRDCDVVVDASDNFATRFMANDACVFANKPYVYGAIFRFDGQLSVFNYRGSACYRCLFPNIPPQDSLPNCAEAGVLGVLPGIVGSLQANEALKIILDHGDVAAGKLILFDSMATEFRNFKIPKNPACPVCGESPVITRLFSETALCGISGDEGVDEIDVESVHQKLLHKKLTLIDVRTCEEREICMIADSLSYPLNLLKSVEIPLSLDSEIVLHCKSGSRSRQAVILM